MRFDCASLLRFIMAKSWLLQEDARTVYFSPEASSSVGAGEFPLLQRLQAWDPAQRRIGRSARGALVTLALLASCAPSHENRLAGYHASEVPFDCRMAVYDNPRVRQLMIAGAGVPGTMAENQNALAFAKAEAERKCMQDTGLMKGGVEPVRYQWYPSPF